MELASLILPSNFLLPLPFHFQPHPTGSDMYLLGAEQLHAPPKCKAGAGVPAISRPSLLHPAHSMGAYLPKSPHISCPSSIQKLSVGLCCLHLKVQVP